MPPAGRRRLGVRTKAAAGMLLLAVPLTIWFGVHTLGDRKYYFISLLVLLETMLPFFLVFEGRKPRARELAVISVLCAAGVASRAAFFMLPEFKPVAAVVIVSGVAFGGELAHQALGGEICRQAIDASERSSARPTALRPPAWTSTR